MTTQHVEGEQRGQVTLYALSTCGWCRKTKELLRELNVAFDYADVDLLSGPERAAAMEQLRKWNPRGSFPSLVIDERVCIVGFDAQRIREALAP